MRPELRSLLEQLHQAVDVTVGILVRENEPRASYWQRLLGELAQVDSSDLEEVVSLMSRISGAIGVGMGTLSDTYVSRDFEPALDRVSALAWQAECLARELGTGPVRRHLTTLETALLEAGREEDAVPLRELLQQDQISLDAASAAVEHLPDGDDESIRAALRDVRQAIAERR